MPELKIKLKEQWIDVNTGNVLQSMVTEETIHIDPDLDFEKMSQHYISTRVGSSTIDGVLHEVTIDSGGLTKEQMFNFILDNHVTLQPDGSTWTKHNDDGTQEKISIDYTVSINGCGMAGYGLVDAINYYVREIQSK